MNYDEPAAIKKRNEPNAIRWRVLSKQPATDSTRSDRRRNRAIRFLHQRSAAAAQRDCYILDRLSRKPQLRRAAVARAADAGELPARRSLKLIQIARGFGLEFA